MVSEPPVTSSVPCCHCGSSRAIGLRSNALSIGPVGATAKVTLLPVAPLIKVLDKSHLDLTTPLGRGFIAFLSAMVEDERQRIVKRANEGRVAARKRGARFGPQAQAQ